MGCIEYMPFRNRLFSWIFSFTVFHEVDIKAALENVRELCLPDSYVVVSMLKKVKVGLEEMLEKFANARLKLIHVIDQPFIKDVIYIFRCEYGKD